MRKRTNLVKGLMAGAVLAGGVVVAAPAMAAVTAPQAQPTCITITVTITDCLPTATPTPQVTTLEAPNPDPTCTPTCVTCDPSTGVGWRRHLLDVALLVDLGVRIG
ncbi:hypothetical protein [Microbispora triticiradicis]|uniref:hypothetical protein n=1 Tax=Microbispora triticiradicis TaxID=2200763 RepID=UPI001AD6CED2|nr:hypothetical protein [Microbispora triticiradicis]MBO4271703.1 hypothetical protein [Microbispora triticiradicis]